MLLKRRKVLFKKIDLYPVTCQALSRGRDNYKVLMEVIKGGARIIQLREKELSDQELFRMAKKFREITERHGLLLIINDNIDLAMQINADGVHLGQGDTPLPEARERAPHLLIGISTHNGAEAIRAQSGGADYINIGPVFPTQTKNTSRPPVGVELIQRLVPGLSIPFTVMGGINGNNIDEILKAGATKIAMVTGITQAEDIAGTVKRLRERIKNRT